MRRYPGLACLAKAESLFSRPLEGHEKRVGNFASTICTALGLDDVLTNNMKFVGRFHDIGKIVVPEPILEKSAPLTQSEWAVIKEHPGGGHYILRAETGDAIMEFAAIIALNHHERFDGSGYPNGLKGTEIPMPGRIASICDVYDALREDRVYRPGMPHEVAIEKITLGDGRTSPDHFDPSVMAAFKSVERQFARDFSASL